MTQNEINSGLEVIAADSGISKRYGFYLDIKIYKNEQ